MLICLVKLCGPLIWPMMLCGPWLVWWCGVAPSLSGNAVWPLACLVMLWGPWECCGTPGSVRWCCGTPGKSDDAVWSLAWLVMLWDPWSVLWCCGAPVLADDDVGPLDLSDDAVGTLELSDDAGEYKCSPPHCTPWSGRWWCGAPA